MYVQDLLTKSNMNMESYSFTIYTSFGEHNFVSHDVSTIFVVFHGFQLLSHCKDILKSCTKSGHVLKISFLLHLDS